MPKRSAIEQQIAALQAELENADTDDEVWLKDETGHEIKVSGKRATTILSRFSKLWETEDSGEGGEEEAEEEKPDPKPAGGGYFGKRKS